MLDDFLGFDMAEQRQLGAVELGQASDLFLVAHHRRPHGFGHAGEAAHHLGIVGHADQIADRLAGHDHHLVHFGAMTGEQDHDQDG